MSTSTRRRWLACSATTAPAPYFHVRDGTNDAGELHGHSRRGAAGQGRDAEAFPQRRQRWRSSDKRLTNVAHALHLPRSRETLYELTKLSDEAFEAKIADGTIHRPTSSVGSADDQTPSQRWFQARQRSLIPQSTRADSETGRGFAGGARASSDTGAAADSPAGLPRGRPYFAPGDRLPPARSSSERSETFSGRLQSIKT
jgi:hypothetical protein